MDFISDLQRNFMPLPEVFLQQMEPADKFILAFPRSGSRWLMRVLAGIVTGPRVPDDESTHWEQPLPGSKTLAQLQRRKSICADAHSWDPQTSAPGPFGRTQVFRSHHLAEVIVRCSGPVVCLVREAVPTLCSYYHFARQQKIVTEDVTLDAFCETHLPMWKDHVSTMLALWATSPNRVLFITYRDPGPFTKAQMKSCAAHLSIPVGDVEATDRALDWLAESLAKLNAQPTTLHPRGANQALKEGFPPDLRQWIESQTQGLFEEVKSAEEARLRA
jgi:hypothetical protein